MPADISNLGAIVLAGGLGTRVRHLLGDVPKPMAPVLGRPFIEWIVRYLSAQGIKKVILSTGIGANQVSQHFASQPVPKISVECIAESEPLGTGGAVRHAISHARTKSKSWFILNGDSLVFIDLTLMLRSLGEKSTGVIAVRYATDTSRYGSLELDAQHRVTAFREKQPGHGWINAGIYLLRNEALDSFPDKSPLSMETEVFTSLIAGGAEWVGHKTEAPFLDVGTPETLPEADLFVKENFAQFGTIEPAHEPYSG